MDKPRFLQVDVFGATPGTGNPLGVVVGADAWTAAAMQSFASWTDLVETTFLLPPTVPGASYRLRIFTPSREIPFAGHPTLGSAHVALRTGRVVTAGNSIVQECLAGLLPIRLHPDGFEAGLAVLAPAARIVPPPDGAAALLDSACRGIERGAIAPALVEGGRSWWICEARSESDLRSWSPDHAAILALAVASGALGLCAFARSGREEYQVVVRAFPAAVGIVEDPASGAANALVAVLIASTEPASPLAAGYRVSQGREMGHDALIDVEVDGAHGVWVGGRSHIIVDGELSWPAAHG